MGVLRRPHIGPHSSIRTPNKAFTGGASGSFDPTSIAGMVAWFKADAGTSTTTDGVAISQWNDQSGNANHLIQGTGANQPLYKAAIQNGLAIVRFDGINDFLQATAVNVAQADTLFAVAKNIAADPTNRNITGGNTAAQGIFRRSTTDFVSVFAGTIQDTAITWGTTAFHYVSFVANGASSGVWVDGASAAIGGSPGANALTSLTVGVDAAVGGNWWQGDIAEVLVYNSGLSTGNRQNVENYLKARWGL